MFQKCIAVEHLYSMTCQDKCVLPFSVMLNLLLFALTNSKIALNIVNEILPAGGYVRVTSWRDNLASEPCQIPERDCVVAFVNDQIIQKKWKVKAAAKARVRILTSICQASCYVIADSNHSLT